MSEGATPASARTEALSRAEKLNTRAAGVVGLAVLCSRVLGLAREQIFAALRFRRLHVTTVTCNIRYSQEEFNPALPRRPDALKPVTGTGYGRGLLHRSGTKVVCNRGATRGIVSG